MACFDYSLIKGIRVAETLGNRQDLGAMGRNAAQLFLRYLEKMKNDASRLGTKLELLKESDELPLYYCLFLKDYIIFICNFINIVLYLKVNDCFHCSLPTPAIVNSSTVGPHIPSMIKRNGNGLFQSEWPGSLNIIMNTLTRDMHR